MNSSKKLIEMPPKEETQEVKEVGVQTQAPTTQVADEEIIDIQLALPTKRKFRINGDPNKILELNISDMTVLDRLEKGWDSLQKDIDKVGKLDTKDDKLVEKLHAIDKSMRKQVDYIFDANVSEVCADNGTMYDPYQGQIRYEHIIDTLLGLYTENINTEYKKFRARTKKHTDKYLSKR